jgi:hypothetical protein
MEKGLKAKLNPITILGLWTVSMVVLTPICMFISNIGASGGEQKPLTTLVTMILVTLYGLTILSISTAIIFRQWFKKNWWFVFVIALTIIPTAKDLWDNNSKYSYSFRETTEEINGDTIVTKTEFYNESDFKKIRSIRIWKNSKKDSIWVTYSETGDIIKQETYHNDILVTK